MIPNDFVVSRSLAKALAAFVEATPRLGPEHSSEIAARLANPLKEKFGFPGDMDATLLLCALYFKTFSRFNSEEDPLSVGTSAASTQPTANIHGTGLLVDDDSSSLVIASPVKVGDGNGDNGDPPDQLPPEGRE